MDAFGALAAAFGWTPDVIGALEWDELERWLLQARKWDAGRRIG